MKLMRKISAFFKALFWIFLCAVLVFVGIRFGPTLYYRFFGSGNTQWISEQFSEQLKEKNELVVYETTLEGQETISQEAWLLGKVQEVVVPYSYSISFVIDLQHSSVTVDPDTNSIQVHLPLPKASYSKLTVDEANMKKHDWLYPLTPERYASIKTEIENKRFKECSENPAYLDAAWATAVKNMESLFKSVAEQSEQGMTCAIVVIQDDTPPASDPLTDAGLTSTPVAPSASQAVTLPVITSTPVQ